MGIYHVAFNLFGIPQGRMFSDYSLASLFHAEYILLEIRPLSADQHGIVKDIGRRL